MTRIIVHITKIVIAAITALLLASCGIEVRGSGNVVTQKRNADADFTSVSASNGLEVIIEQKAEKSITVEADDNLQEHIKTEVSKGELVISSDVNIRKASSKKVIVTMPSVKSIESSSGSSVTSKNTIKGESLDLSTSSGSHLEVDVDVKSLKSDSSSGSHLTVRGKTDRFETDSSSGSHITAKDLTASYVDSEASSGSHTTVNPANELSAQASSGGHIYYVSTPEKLNKQTSSGGSVSQD